MGEYLSSGFDVRGDYIHGPRLEKTTPKIGKVMMQGKIQQSIDKVGPLLMFNERHRAHTGQKICHNRKCPKVTL